VNYSTHRLGIIKVDPDGCDHGLLSSVSTSAPSFVKRGRSPTQLVLIRPPLRIRVGIRWENSRQLEYGESPGLRARSTHLDAVPRQELSVRLRVPSPHIEQRVDLEWRVELRRLEVREHWPVARSGGLEGADGDGYEGRLAGYRVRPLGHPGRDDSPASRGLPEGIIAMLGKVCGRNQRAERRYAATTTIAVVSSGVGKPPRNQWYKESVESWTQMVEKDDKFAPVQDILS
jgi:hypothetical protein